MRAVDRKVVWFDTGFLPIAFGFTMCERAYYAALKKMCVKEPDRYELDGTGACTHIIRRADGKAPRLVCIVSLGDQRGLSRAQTVATLAHEAVHVWQTALEAMRQTGISGDEVEAYAIQYFTQCMVGEIM